MTIEVDDLAIMGLLKLHRDFIGKVPTNINFRNIPPMSKIANVHLAYVADLMGEVIFAGSWDPSIPDRNKQGIKCFNKEYSVLVVAGFSDKLNRIRLDTKVKLLDPKNNRRIFVSIFHIMKLSINLYSTLYLNIAQHIKKT